MNSEAMRYEETQKKVNAALVEWALANASSVTAPKLKEFSEKAQKLRSDFGNTLEFEGGMPPEMQRFRSQLEYELTEFERVLGEASLLLDKLQEQEISKFRANEYGYTDSLKFDCFDLLVAYAQVEKGAGDLEAQFQEFFSRI